MAAGSFSGHAAGSNHHDATHHEAQASRAAGAPRTWREPACVIDLDELAFMLCDQLWPLCAAFRVGRLTFLNDSEHEDGAQQYLVLRDGEPIDSIGVSQVRDPRRLAAYLRGLAWIVPMSTEFSSARWTRRITSAHPHGKRRVFHSKDEPCPLCSCSPIPRAVPSPLSAPAHPRLPGSLRRSA